jgi:hypothetical protein
VTETSREDIVIRKTKYSAQVPDTSLITAIVTDDTVEFGFAWSTLSVPLEVVQNGLQQLVETIVAEHGQPVPEARAAVSAAVEPEPVEVTHEDVEAVEDGDAPAEARDEDDPEGTVQS